MLYKKNLAKTLDPKLFKNPTSEYRGAPFFSWNCRLTKELLDTQIDNMKAMGYGGFFMHVRAGMDTYYLGDEYLGLIRSCTEKAKRENMYAWLYDEDRWPSGAAGGFVTKDPAFRSRFLALVPATHLKVAENRRSYLKDGTRPLYDISNEAKKSEAIRDGKPYYIATYDIIFNEKGELANYRLIGRGEKAVGERFVAFSDVSHDTRFNGYPYVDALNKKAIEKFIEITHESFKKTVGDEFDKTVPAIFTDEPQYYREKILGFPLEKKVCCVAWTPDFDTTYKKSYGTSIIDSLPEIFWDLEGQRTSVERYRFRDHLCQRFVDGFAKTCGEWCDKNGLPLTGHVMEEPTLHSQTSAVGEAMRSYKYFGYPGIDMLCNRTEFTTAKQAQSAVHQYGKEAMISELYGVTNWNFDFRGHKFQGDWQAAMGVTVRVPHLTWVSMKGDAKRDYPSSFNYHAPWYREYPYIEDHFARLNTALTRGKPIVDIGVIHPIESCWINWGPVASTQDIRSQLDENFKNFIEWMIFADLDFDYVNESDMKTLCRYGVKNENGKIKLRVGKMAYSTVIVPGAITLRSSTLKVLEEFKNAGGRVIFMGECPTHVDAVQNDGAKALFEACERIPFERYSLVKALERDRSIEIRENNGALTQNLIYQMRQDGAAKWVFICNAKDYPRADVISPQDINIKIRGEYKPTLYNTITGEIEEITYTAKDGYTYIPRRVFLHDSLLIKLERSKEKSKKVDGVRYDTLESFVVTDSVSYTLDEPNVVVLDTAKYRYNNSEWQGLTENLKIRDAVRSALNVHVTSGYQPWALKEEVYTDTLEREFTINSEIDVKGALLAAEDVDISEFTFNGVKLDTSVVGYFTDVAIQSIRLPDFEAGTHKICVKMPFGARTNVENLFVLGDFGTKVQGAAVTITKKPEKLGFGSVVNQGLAFYSSNITYKIPVTVKEDGCSVKIHCNFYRGALIKAFIDGNDAGRIVFAPYDLVIDGVEKGEHIIELKLFGNRHNSFAALHNANRNTTWFGPGAWKTKGDDFSLDYHLRELGIITSPVISVVKKV